MMVAAHNKGQQPKDNRSSLNLTMLPQFAQDHPTEQPADQHHGFLARVAADLSVEWIRIATTGDPSPQVPNDVIPSFENRR